MTCCTMGFKSVLLICCKFILLLALANCLNHCAIENRQECTYTVSCKQRPTIVPVVPCAYEANVTFIIKNTKVETLTQGYFSSTNFDRRVKYIIASFNDWPTLETSTFKYFLHTLSLNLTGNGIANINDKAFFELESLKYLYLSHNKIKTISRETFSIGTKNQLEYLDLSYNILTSLQTRLFSNLIKLKHLNLQNNQLISISNECFTDLTELSILFLQNNNISSLNETLLPLNLGYLDISNNYLKKLTDTEISHMTFLLYLKASNNLLEIVYSNAFANFKNLEGIDLSNNKIVSPIEPQTLMNNHLLKFIDLFGNNITTIMELSFQFNSLKYINLDQNNLSINISRNFLKGLKNIKSLNITNENVSTINEKAFIDMQNLQFLNLSRNTINEVHNTSFEFEHESKLSILDLSYNFLNNLFFLQNFTSCLTELYLNNNKLTILRTGIFEKHKNLIKLDLYENDIVLLEPFSLPLVKIQYLNLDYNYLRGSIMKNVFSPAPFIRYLNICNFKIQRIEENAFENLQLLTKLNLSNNEIEFIHSNSFRNVEKMYSLDLSYNRLSDFEIKTSLSSLTAIYLSNNKFERMPNFSSNSSTILYIDISNNKISDIESTGFENIPNVRVLKLAYNSIKTFSNNHNSITKLSDLTLSSNLISEINFDSFDELVSIDLSNNSLELINITTFNKCHLLQYLDISTNKLREISPGTFQGLQILKFLNLSSNLLTNLRYGTFRGLAKAEMIDISKNKIMFLDVNIFHDCSDLKRLIIDYNYIQSVNVERLLVVAPSLISLSLGGNPISCEEIVKNVKLKESKNLEVTSIHNIFHDDNVHGIRCGNGSYGSSTKQSRNTANDKKLRNGNDSTGNSSVTALFVWCIIITVLAILAVAYYFYRKRVKMIGTRLYRRDTVNMSRSECSNEL